MSLLNSHKCAISNLSNWNSHLCECQDSQWDSQWYLCESLRFPLRILGFSNCGKYSKNGNPANHKIHRTPIKTCSFRYCEITLHPMIYLHFTHPKRNSCKYKREHNFGYCEHNQHLGQHIAEITLYNIGNIINGDKRLKYFESVSKIDNTVKKEVFTQNSRVRILF